MELSETKHQMRSVSEGNQSLEMRRQEAMQELEQLRAQIEACQKENRRLLKEQEISREEFAEIMGSRWHFCLSTYKNIYWNEMLYGFFM